MTRCTDVALAAASSSVAGILTAVATLAIAIGGVITALTGIIPLIRRTKRLEAKVDGVHTIVNQQHTDLVNYQATLERALMAAGVPIPRDQSKGPD
jgi:hypothetical protein